jgi:glycerophosphoryl diester phosphodiesterase
MVAWLEAQPEGIKQLLSMGIDGIITDDPGLARKLMVE